MARQSFVVAALTVMFLCLCAVAPAVATRIVIGTSVEGRPIVAWSFGPDRARRKVLVVGCIHGN